ncbi:hypothetical protein GYH30_034398 [Glycine max]|nr:hypothetical protein JHK87_034455 [Glycine soja]KAH1144150.1 hypothetical protein GYH30_034398 [Glycine max]
MENYFYTVRYINFLNEWLGCFVIFPFFLHCSRSIPGETLTPPTLSPLSISFLSRATSVATAATTPAKPSPK